MTIAYLANSLPEPVEAYVSAEICELRGLGQRVVACSIKRPRAEAGLGGDQATLYLFPLSLAACLRTSWACACDFRRLAEFVWRAIAGPEPPTKRIRALAHTWLGVYLAIQLRGRGIQHIHVHHGYFASWVGMVAAKILGAGFSLTLHGSDLLVRRDYLDAKLKNCRLCVTVSQFNRRFILENYPEIDTAKIRVHLVGIDIDKWTPAERRDHNSVPLILSVGRLHRVKNHTFLIQACRKLKSTNTKFQCAIAGEGDERARLEALIEQLNLQRDIVLLGQVSRENLPSLYARADVVVLTSLSEGIPVALMEAMAMKKIVLAPAITGIPELISDGETGFLYSPGYMEEFVIKLERLLRAPGATDHVRQMARSKIEREFNAAVNLRGFADDVIEHVSASSGAEPTVKTNEDPVLQQI